MKKILQRLKIIFIPICWFTGFIWIVKYNQNISGHEYVEQEDKSLVCDVCGRISK